MNITSTGPELGDAKSLGRTPDPLGSWESVATPAPRSAPSTKAKIRAKYSLPTDVAADVRKAFIGTAYMREKTVNTLTRAAEAYDRKRYEEALRLGRVVADATPGVAAVRELTGLAAYRAERWAMAKIHLRAYFTISDDPEHLPLVMDADRANHRVRLWYALADVYDRAGDTSSARELFARIVLAEPDAYDAADRLVELGATLPRKNRKRRVTPTSKKKFD